MVRGYQSSMTWLILMTILCSIHAISFKPARIPSDLENEQMRDLEILVHEKKDGNIYFNEEDLNPSNFLSGLLKKRSILSVSPDSSMTLQFKAFEYSFTIFIEPNHNLIPANAQVYIQNSQGIEIRPLISVPTFRGYIKKIEDDRGLVIERNIGWVSLIFFDDIDDFTHSPSSKFNATIGFGDFSFEISYQGWNGTSFSLPLVSKNQGGSKKLNGTDTRKSHCSFDKEVHLFSPTEDKNHPQFFSKRQVGSCPSRPKELYMGVAADCTYTKLKGGVDASIKQVIQVWNKVSALYSRTFNVYVGVIDIFIVPDCTVIENAVWNQQCSASYTMDIRLSDFSKWRSTNRNSDAGLWHLLTACDTVPVIGLSWGGMLCMTTSLQNSDGSFVSGTGVSSAATGDEFPVVAHEIGHSFSAIHDCGDSCNCQGSSCTQCCPCNTSPTHCSCQSQYLMNPTNDAKSTDFSPCSIQQICNFISLSGSSCLVDPGSKKTVNGSICGNGIREGDEECDCGTPEQCKSDPCCLPTCKLQTGAQCSDKNGVCCKNCKLLAKDSFVCRPSKGSCDFQETCDGKSGDCPVDVFAPDGSSCNITGAYCASGLCTNRDLQCQIIGAQVKSPGACSGDLSGSCQMNCASTDPNMCYPMSSNYVDGTDCALGRCYKGECVRSPQNILSWIQNNVLLFSVALLALLSFIISLCCCICPCRMKKRPKDQSRVVRQVPISDFDYAPQHYPTRSSNYQ